MEKQEKTEKIVSKKTLEGANAAAQLLLEKHRQYDSVSVGPHGGLKAKQRMWGGSMAIPEEV